MSSTETTAPLLTAALIVRDEQHFLPDCLRSLDGVANEVVVVDTGSTDRTCEIVQEAGARLLHHAWNDDFAAARNVALDAARGDWILYIDADERVVGGLPPGFRDQLRDPHLVGLTVKFKPATGFTFYREPRLFRRHQEIRFRGVIHETHLPDLYQVARREKRVIVHSDLALEHLGYDGDISHKHPRNLPLLQARVREEPGHVYSWWHLGWTLDAMGRPDEAEEAWNKGLDAVRRAWGASSVRSLPYLALLGHQWARDGDYDQDLWTEAWQAVPGHPTLLWLKARRLIGRNQWFDAIEPLEDLTKVDLDEEVARQYATEEQLFLQWVPASLALCLFHCERYDEAAALYGELERRFPGEEYRVKKRLAELRGARLKSSKMESSAQDGASGG